MLKNTKKCGMIYYMAKSHVEADDMLAKGGITMKNRYEKIMLEAEKGITFEVTEGTNGVLGIRALKVKPNSYSEIYENHENYANPPIPQGYEYIYGKWQDGFVIQRVSDGSEFVWIPVGSLDPDGTLDGVHFSEKFGRRNWQKEEFSDSKFHEDLEGELLEQVESVKKYGGFYISRYDISKSSDGKPQSVRNAMPWTTINYYEAKEVASSMEDKEDVKSHLTFGAEYDTALAWLIKSRAKTLKEITIDSSEWGNYWDKKEAPKLIVKTGRSEEWCANNIYDLAGNIEEWTQEKYKDLNRVPRGGCCKYRENRPVSFRRDENPFNQHRFLGFRVTLYIK